jgi:hypothetical protein
MNEVMGLTRIDDQMLLTELINYKPKLNVDRIVAFGHVLIYDEFLQKIAPNVRIVTDDGNKPKPRPPRSPFIINNTSNNNKNKSPFILK